ncbi:MAG: hypothetical protein A3I98_00595 [Candidatus Taylorbacteria bacterium RIFCSPLOWO2_02_FULL_45_10b]|nr:MAG: hypothetical protein A3A23_01090 [Candidatus Taylorbacteria bacterium RIFCSPLOWO2_01_FULL_45_59]OHA38464.1 MAG: hypothetical protein A3I98_00595 [Candidatus Taylorbacteria bacterium RIFCSPLOWO2_02_FULL_45_10b]
MKLTLFGGVVHDVNNFFIEFDLIEDWSDQFVYLGFTHIFQMSLTVTFAVCAVIVIMAFLD